jgi:hypothetical protein
MSDTETHQVPNTKRIVLNCTLGFFEQIQNLASRRGNGKIAEIMRQAISVYTATDNALLEDPSTRVQFVRGDKRSELLLPWFYSDTEETV